MISLLINFFKKLSTFLASLDFSKRRNTAVEKGAGETASKLHYTALVICALERLTKLKPVKRGETLACPAQETEKDD